MGYLVRTFLIGNTCGAFPEQKKMGHKILPLRYNKFMVELKRKWEIRLISNNI